MGQIRVDTWPTGMTYDSSSSLLFFCLDSSSFAFPTHPSYISLFPLFLNFNTQYLEMKTGWGRPGPARPGSPLTRAWLSPCHAQVGMGQGAMAWLGQAHFSSPLWVVRGVRTNEPCQILYDIDVHPHGYESDGSFNLISSLLLLLLTLKKSVHKKINDKAYIP